MRDQACAPASPAPADWAARLAAVCLLLQHSVARTLPPDAKLLHPGVPADELRAEVLAGVSRLEQLLAELQPLLLQGEALKGEAASLRQSLDLTRHELAGTRVGEMLARHLAHHDVLTSLPNRRYFRERLTSLLQPAHRPAAGLALLYLDLDGFKAVNDLHGHGVGDELLRIVAERLRGGLRDGDMVSRLGGDEFGCLISPLVSRSQVERLAVKLVRLVSAPVRIGALSLVVRPSIGIALAPMDGQLPNELLERADTAMFRAKREGGGPVFFDARLDLPRQQAQDLASSDLPSAAARSAPDASRALNSPGQA